jgi:hypothetical protein
MLAVDDLERERECVCVWVEDIGSLEGSSGVIGA